MVTKEKEYQIYHQMKQRCYNKQKLNYKDYGGRGIIICERWLGEDGYKNFIQDMGYKPFDDYEIDRIDNDGNYEPSNCRWTNRETQSMNKQNTVYATPGLKNNSLTIMYEVERHVTEKKNRRMIFVKCDCGNEKIVRLDKFISGKVKTCGSKNCKNNGPIIKVI